MFMLLPFVDIPREEEQFREGDKSRMMFKSESSIPPLLFLRDYNLH